MAEEKQEQNALEQKLHRQRHDEGLQALHQWLYIQRARVNRYWMDATGDELLQYQGEARGIRRMIRLLEDGPTVKTQLRGE